MDNKKQVIIALDEDGNKIVVIPMIIFQGKRTINWDEVEHYLLKYVGNMIEVAETKDIIYIGKQFPDEYKGSRYTRYLRGAYAKAKANAVQGLPELIPIATHRKWAKNKKNKHEKQASNGWYYYKTRFAIPVYDFEDGKGKYNIYSARLVVNYSKNKLYLYDVVDLKKESSVPLEILNT